MQIKPGRVGKHLPLFKSKTGGKTSPCGCLWSSEIQGPTSHLAVVKVGVFTPFCFWVPNRRLGAEGQPGQGDVWTSGPRSPLPAGAHGAFMSPPPVNARPCAGHLLSLKAFNYHKHPPRRGCYFHWTISLAAPSWQ